MVRPVMLVTKQLGKAKKAKKTKGWSKKRNSWWTIYVQDASSLFALHIQPTFQTIHLLSLLFTIQLEMFNHSIMILPLIGLFDFKDEWI